MVFSFEVTAVSLTFFEQEGNWFSQVGKTIIRNGPLCKKSFLVEGQTSPAN